MKNLKRITAAVLGIPEKEIKDSLVRRESAEWDSFNHLMLISEIEKELDLQFTMAEVEKIQTFGDLRTTVEKKL